MSTRTRLFAVVTALVMVVGVGVTSASAATPACGASCPNFSNAVYGAPSSPTFVLADQLHLQNVGQPLTLAQSSATNPGEDFIFDDAGTVNDFFQAGLISGGLDALYSSDSVGEIEYAPSGAPTGLCVGVPTPPANGTRVTLEPCGVSAKTTWIVDNGGTFTGTTFTTSTIPLINGATNSSFFDPYVLTSLAPGLPLTTSMLRITNSVLSPTQLWGAKNGVL